MKSSSIAAVLLPASLLNGANVTAFATTPSQRTDAIASFILQGLGFTPGFARSTSLTHVLGPGPESSATLEEKVPSPFHTGTSQLQYTNRSTASSRSVTNVSSTESTSSFTTEKAWTLPQDGSGASYATACQEEWSSYKELQYQSRNTAGPFFDYTTSKLVPLHSAPMTALCEANIQIVGNLSIMNYSTTWYRHSTARFQRLSRCHSLLQAAAFSPPTVICSAARSRLWARCSTAQHPRRPAR